MNVISIDPAPAKGGVIFNGECWKDLAPDDLVDHCEDLGSRRDGLLLCWDAPLTGWHEQQPFFSQRKIEKFSPGKSSSKLKREFQSNPIQDVRIGQFRKGVSDYLK